MAKKWVVLCTCWDPIYTQTLINECILHVSALDQISAEKLCFQYCKSRLWSLATDISIMTIALEIPNTTVIHEISRLM